MELFQLIQIIKKNLAVILSLGITACFGTLIYLSFKPLTYQVFFAITTSQAGIDSTSDFKYDNYYSQQAIDLFTESLEKWFRDSQLVNNTYQEAGLNLQELSSREKNQLLKARKLAPNYLEVKFRTQNPQEGTKIYQSLTRLLEEKTDQLGGDQEVWFKLNFTEPVIIPNKWNPILIIILSFSIGAFLGSIFALLKHYFTLAKK